MNPASLYKALMTDNKGFPTERERERAISIKWFCSFEEL
jgi:hypothetical protein